MKLALLLGLAVAVSHAQNCPLLGPAYPAATDVAGPAFAAARDIFEAALASDSDVKTDSVSFAFEIYRTRQGRAESIYRTFNTASSRNVSAQVGPETLFRINSISKVITVYTMLAKLGYQYWHEPISKFVPELADLPSQPNDVIRSVDWSEITLEALASQISGLAKEYAFGDISAFVPGVPGLRTLDDSEVVRCGAAPLKPCLRAEILKYMQQNTWPVFPSFHTPTYSSMAFELLAFAIENITGTPFPDLVQEHILQPLNLTRTFLTHPGNDSNAAVFETWDMDYGDAAPDLTTLGNSILTSSLLPPSTTRRWLRPVTHSSTLTFSLGSPWEIMRVAVPVDSTNTTTRIVDVYTKQGGGGSGEGYTSLLLLSPDHELGVSILTGGPGSTAAMLAMRKLVVDVWLPAAEAAAREQAKQEFAGRYVASSAGDSESVLDVSLQSGEPGLAITQIVSNGTDVLALLMLASPVAGDGEGRVWLYPTGLVQSQGKGKGTKCRRVEGSGKRVAFRGVLGRAGARHFSGGEDCSSWAERDNVRWGNYPTDLVVFETGPDGKASAVEVPVLGVTLQRVDKE
ncbi:hypothetical protein VTJ49DRAFT_3296 [Mycothermus thermophilus]|uniref:Beta-lactamase-related domain-containing protein n=1 Tax=Humicola insolens TaxID=85995 RepID=A0ABR3V7U6_HUMIN